MSQLVNQLIIRDYDHSLEDDGEPDRPDYTAGEPFV